MRKRGRPPKPNKTRVVHLTYGDENSSRLIEAIAERRGGLSNSSLIRFLIYEEAARLGIRVADLREETDPSREREPALVG